MKFKIILILVILLGIIPHVRAHTSYPIVIQCPIDGEKFTVQVTGSYTTFKTLRDFEKRGAVGELYENYVNTCSHCHYSGYVKDFDTTFNDTTKANILKLLEPFKKLKITEVLENEIAIQIHIYLQKSNDDIANLFLISSYLIKHNTFLINERKTIQKLAIAYFIKAIENKEYVKAETYPAIEYLIGDLYRRVGEFESAILYFDWALTNDYKKPWIKTFAEEQRALAVLKNDDNAI